MDYSVIEENIKRVMENIARSLASSGREPGSVRLLAATKGVSAEVINFALSRGISLIGENRACELLAKYDSLERPEGLEIHFLGSLQTNKVRQIIDRVALIHSVDSIKLAAEISRRALEQGKVMDILAEVNIGGEASKCGIAPEKTGDFMSGLSRLGGIKVRGLMAIPPVCDAPGGSVKYFERMRKIFVDTAAQNMDNIDMSVLSMGMSGDYEQAVACGSTLVRVGTAIFGKRTYPA